MLVLLFERAQTRKRILRPDGGCDTRAHGCGFPVTIFTNSARSSSLKPARQLITRSSRAIVSAFSVVCGGARQVNGSSRGLEVRSAADLRISASMALFQESSCAP